MLLGGGQGFSDSSSCWQRDGRWPGAGHLTQFCNLPLHIPLVLSPLAPSCLQVQTQPQPAGSLLPSNAGDQRLLCFSLGTQCPQEEGRAWCPADQSRRTDRQRDGKETPGHLPQE